VPPWPPRPRNGQAARADFFLSPITLSSSSPLEGVGAPGKKVGGNWGEGRGEGARPREGSLV